MLIFFATYALTYGLAHGLLLRWLRPAFGWGWRAASGYALFSLLMIVLPAFSRMAEQADDTRLAQWLGLPAFFWMVFVLLLTVLGLASELANLGLSLVSRGQPASRRPRIGARSVVVTAQILFFVVTGWGLIEARSLRLETVVIRSSKLPAGTPPLRIVQISDVHLGMLTGPRDVDRLLRVVAAARPDLLLCSGDLFDSPGAKLLAFADRIGAGCRPPLGKLGVLGNHEYYTGAARSRELYSRAGVRLLHAERTALPWHGVEILVAGVDDPAGRLSGDACRTSEDEALPLPSEAAAAFTVLLKHQPLVRSGSAPRLDLQLSGHTHRGQVFPFHGFVRMVYPVLSGLREIGEGQFLYVSRGSGTWGPPLRVLAPPEVTLFLIGPASPRPPAP